MIRSRAAFLVAWLLAALLFPHEPAAQTAWDTVHSSASLSFGHANNTIAQTNANAGTWKSAIGTTSHSSGKYYLEMTILSNEQGGWIAGFTNSSSVSSTFCGNSASVSFGYQAYASAAGGYGFTGGTQNWVNVGWPVWGVVVELAVDVGNSLAWARTDRNANWNGSGTANPATGTGGYTFTASGALFPCWSGEEATGTNMDAASLNAGGYAFAGTIPSGFSAWDTTTPGSGGIQGTHGPSTWSPTNKNAGTVLSNANLTATSGSASSTEQAFTSSGYNGGRVYLEVTQQYNSDNTHSGWIAGTEPLSGCCPTGGQPGTGGVGYIGGGNNGGLQLWATQTNPSGTTLPGPLGNTHVIAYAINVDLGLIWQKDLTAAANWNALSIGNPATNAGGWPIQSLSDVYAEWSGVNNNGNSAGTINFGASAFTGTIPSGFSAWDATGGGSSYMPFFTPGPF